MPPRRPMQQQPTLWDQLEEPPAPVRELASLEGVAMPEPISEAELAAIDASWHPDEEAWQASNWHEEHEDELGIIATLSGEDLSPIPGMPPLDQHHLPIEERSWDESWRYYLKGELLREWAANREADLERWGPRPPGTPGTIPWPPHPFDPHPPAWIKRRQEERERNALKR